MASVRHLEFAKITVLVTWPISAYDHSPLFQISLWSANIAPRYSQITIFNMASVRYLEFAKLWIFAKNPWWELRHTSPTKFDRNRIILGWYMEIMLFLKWRPSAILNLRKLQFWSRDLYRHVILHLCSKFRVDRSIWRRDIAKTIFHMASVRNLGFVMTWSYCIRKLHFTFPLNFHSVRFRNFLNILYFMFQHFGWKLPISGLILTIFGENRQNWKLNILTPKRHILGAKHV